MLGKKGQFDELHELEQLREQSGRLRHTITSLRSEVEQERSAKDTALRACCKVCHEPHTASCSHGRPTGEMAPS